MNILWKKGRLKGLCYYMQQSTAKGKKPTAAQKQTWVCHTPPSALKVLLSTTYTQNVYILFVPGDTHERKACGAQIQC